ncbi:MAG: hypothetical protein K0R67_1080, partial [Paenibacillus sp.]|nr:hypothetical protein [Paenibacillus sp.]
AVAFESCVVTDKKLNQRTQVQEAIGAHLLALPPPN